MDYPLSGDAEAVAASLLNASPKPRKIGAKTVNAIERADGAVTAFSENGKVYSVRIKSPFSDDVRGIKIGYTKDAVIRYWGSRIGCGRFMTVSIVGFMMRRPS